MRSMRSAGAAALAVVAAAAWLGAARAQDRAEDPTATQRTVVTLEVEELSGAAAARVAGELRGAEGVREVDLSRADVGRLEVEFDALRGTVRGMLDRLTALGFSARALGAPKASLDRGTVTIEIAAAAPSYRAGTTGELIVVLRPLEGRELYGATIRAGSDDAFDVGAQEVRLQDVVHGREEARIPFSIRRGMVPTQRLMTVTVRYALRDHENAQDFTLRVPVIIE